MRGEILQFDQVSGEGLISGDDGQRYRLSRHDLIRSADIALGRFVDFLPRDDIATEVVVLQPAPLSGTALREHQGPPELSPWGYFVECMRLYVDGNGRARRSEYWWFVLIQGLITLAPFIIGASVVIAGIEGDSDTLGMIGGLFLLVSGIAWLAFVPPGICVTIRRLHDIGLSGWFVLLALIPSLGGLILFIMTVVPSQPYRNVHGPVPRRPRPRNRRRLRLNTSDQEHTMRGEIISVDGLSGDGLITGQDGVRYAFAASSARAIVRAGEQVDFIGTDGVATQVVAASTLVPSDGTAGPVVSPSTGEYDAMFALFQLKGRLRRSHFWISWGILFGIGLIVGLIPAISVIGYALIYPRAAVQVKRLHDMGLTGWVVLLPDAVNAVLLTFLILGGSLPGLMIVFVVANLAWMLLIGMTDSQRGRNTHGLNPKSRIDATAETFA